MIRLDFSDDDPFGGFFTSNDDYCFNVTHVDLVDARIRQVTRGLDICDAPQCTVPLDRPNEDFVFVLIGFQFSFREHDNHIKEIAILENNGHLPSLFMTGNLILLTTPLPGVYSMHMYRAIALVRLEK